MKTIPLTKGYTTCIDDIDYPAVIAVGSWCYEAGYAVHYFADEEGRRTRHYMHRLVMERMLGYDIPTDYQVDHISGAELGKAARLDNRRANLRLATKSENQAAKSSQINSTSGHKGVTRRGEKFDVRLRYYHHRLCLGRYADFDLAVAIYGYAHRVLWREFTSEGQGEIILPVAIQAKLDLHIAALLKAHRITPSGRA